MRSKPETIEPVSVRRARIADTDKVRYRVYSTSTEFIAVIAENALVAVKTSGIARPHKIVRDLPSEGIAIEAKRMEEVKAEAVIERVALSPIRKEDKRELVTELPSREAGERPVDFKPMGLSEMQKPRALQARILPPEMLSQIIEEYAKATTEPPVIPDPEPMTVVADSTAVEMPELQPEPPAAEPPTEPQLSQEEIVLKLAEEEFNKLETSGTAVPSANPNNLSPEEVKKLLDG